MTPSTDADLTPSEEELLRCRRNWLMDRLKRLEVNLERAVWEADAIRKVQEVRQPVPE